MKKIVLILAALVGVMTAQADNYTYLTFEMTDGTKASVPVASLSLTISGTTLTAGSQSFILENLSKMYFSNEEVSTSIEEVDSVTLDGTAEIFDLQGHKVSKAQMHRGVYIVKTKSKTYKIVVK